LTKLKLVVKDGRLLAEHETTLNEEQIGLFHKALHWYEKATNKISRRYARGIQQGKSVLYAEAVALAVPETEEIETRYKKVLSGDCSISKFKEAISEWFYKVKEKMDEADTSEREPGKNLWCDYKDEREIEVSSD